MMDRFTQISNTVVLKSYASGMYNIGKCQLVVYYQYTLQTSILKCPQDIEMKREKDMIVLKN